MPIGVPRIIYCWGEELPAQWTDIYNFIFRRRMVFLMQYLDDELCNQICGLLINIHMEDRSRELEKKEMEKSGLFKNTSAPNASKRPSENTPNAMLTNKQRSIEDLLISEEDLGIDDNHRLERQTLQKISLEWLNWNAQFFDYSEEPYMFYLAELLANDLATGDGQLLFDSNNPNSAMKNVELTKLMTMFKQITDSNKSFNPNFFDNQFDGQNQFNVYSPFRLLTNFASQNYKDFQLDSDTVNRLALKFQHLQNGHKQKHSNVDSLVSDFAQRDLMSQLNNQEMEFELSQKAYAQRKLRKNYAQENTFNAVPRTQAGNYLNLNASEDAAYLEYRDSYRRQTEKAIQEEESKKVFMIINSFGGSVGNGITVHDALQFIKAGSMTLALGVAASAASLALAGGTIGERYVTEGCHVMIHQPEGGLTGQASDIWIDSQEIMKIRLDVAEIYSLSTYRPRHKILRDLDRDFYLTAMETIYYGLADEIATTDVMSEIIDMTNKVWDYHDTQQQKLLESRDSATSGLDT